jgi:hypothetical protein
MLSNTRAGQPWVKPGDDEYEEEVETIRTHSTAAAAAAVAAGSDAKRAVVAAAAVEVAV